MAVDWFLKNERMKVTDAAIKQQYARANESLRDLSKEPGQGGTVGQYLGQKRNAEHLAASGPGVSLAKRDKHSEWKGEGVCATVAEVVAMNPGKQPGGRVSTWLYKLCLHENKCRGCFGVYHGSVVPCTASGDVKMAEHRRLQALRPAGTKAVGQGGVSGNVQGQASTATHGAVGPQQGKSDGGVPVARFGGSGWGRTPAGPYGQAPAPGGGRGRGGGTVGRDQQVLGGGRGRGATATGQSAPPPGGGRGYGRGPPGR